MDRSATPVFTVREINAIVRELLEDGFDDIIVTGELSNVRVHGSGHVYFRLKDAGAQLASVCFRGDARAIDWKLEDGVQVAARGRLTVYEPQGSYQLIARSIEPAGRGELERAFRLLLAKLQAEGLFDEARKRALPRYPSTVAVITSPAGAAIRDILSTLRRRFPCVEVLVVAVPVQGGEAPAAIVHALDAVSRRGGVDAVIVGRGGGSVEDLWAFNDEAVARAIHRCSVPVVSAVGHEKDVTIADLVADRRAATPSMAAEIVVPDRAEVFHRLQSSENAMATRMRGYLGRARSSVSEHLRSYALGRVRGKVEHAMQSLDVTTGRLRQAVRTRACDAATRTESAAARLEALDPRAVMRRGFTICLDARSGRALRVAPEAVAARDVHVAFHDGTVHAVVEGLLDREAT